MEQKSSQRKGPRIPLESAGIQVNFCKNPACDNYGIPASILKQPRGRKAASRGRDGYRLNRGDSGVTQLACLSCKEVFPLKSNQGISEELQRIGGYLAKTLESSCPEPSCSNHEVGISAEKTSYQAFGKTRSGSQRYRCKACGRSFSVGKSTIRQKQPHKNKTIFQLLMNKSPLKRICEVVDVRMETVYWKIDFLHKQCLAFAAERERRLLDGKPIRRLYIGVDRQDYIVNWTRHEDKRNVQLTAVGSADNETGYVFGMHLNYDLSLDVKAVEEEAAQINDCNAPFPFRRYARTWLACDYERAINGRRGAKHGSDGTMKGEIEAKYNEALSREDIEDFEQPARTSKLPGRGMQIHAEYTLYAHFFLLKQFFGGVEKVRFFLDQDSGMRAACLGSFQEEIEDRRCDAFYVRINKDLTIDEKKKALAESRTEFRAAKNKNPGLSDNEIQLQLIKERMSGMAEIGKWKDRWLVHPFPNMSEPEKAVCYLTDYGDYDEDHQAWLFNKASLHAIDRFFMQVRRRLSLLERPFASASSSRRIWHGYSAYNPESIVKLLDIFRVYYNYCLKGQAGKTPAMRLRLAKGVVAPEDIIYYSAN